MTAVQKIFPFLDLRGYRSTMLWADLSAAAVIVFLGIPQGVAYALIAGLEPKMGLYAAIAPAIVGSLMRSSHHVVTGPTNAISLLVAGAVVMAAELGQSPTEVAITLALLVGVMQFGAGVLRLGALIDYISSPVVLGYITGAGVLIGVGQLPNVTNTIVEGGNMFERVWGWGVGVGGMHPLSVVVAVGSLLFLLSLRWLGRLIGKRIPAALITMIVALIVSVVLDLGSRGLMVVSDIGAVPSSMPPLTIPSLENVVTWIPLALACAVLSMVESSSVGRTISQRSGQELDSSLEFTGQGLANIAAAFTGAYPTSGSLSRSALNEQVGGATRMAGVFSGIFILVAVVAAGSLVDSVPIASLAGLLLVVAWDLMDFKAMGRAIRATSGDRLAFLCTLFATWMMPLDKAIYFGVLVSIVMFLRHARLIAVHPLIPDDDGELREAEDDEVEQSCPSIRILNVEGSLFFGAAGELYGALTKAAAEDGVEVLIVRLRPGSDIDVTTSQSLTAVANLLKSRGQRLILVGMKAGSMAILERSGAAQAIGEENLFPSTVGWFDAMEQAIRAGVEAVESHGCNHCPLTRYLPEA